MSEDPIHRANRWNAFYKEDGGLKDMLDGLRQIYFERAADLLPSETDKLLKLSMAAKIVEQVDAAIVATVNHGKIEAHAAESADRIAKLSFAKRRFI